jgi:hypothetical protein
MRLRLFAPLALAAAVALPSAVQAQGRDVYLLPMPTEQMMGAAMGRTQPGVAASSPIGFGPRAGDIFAGFGYQAKATNGEQDGALSVGGGFLDPDKIVGIEAVLTSLSTLRSGFGSRMVGGAKVHKNVSGWGLGLGVEGIFLNGDEFDTKPSVYLAGTRALKVRDADTFNSATINLGLGNGRFQSAQDFAADKSGIGFFVSSSIRVNQWSSAIVDYTGAQVNLALSFAPLKNLPLVITPSMNDITGEAGDKARLSLGAGMSWKY